MNAARSWRDSRERPALPDAGRYIFAVVVALGLLVLGVLIREALDYSGPVAAVGLLLALAACCAWAAIGKAWA